jgi:hypothetical protein
VIKAVLVPGLTFVALFAGAVYFVAEALSEAAETASQPVIENPVIEKSVIEARSAGAACSMRAWPYYDNQCLHDHGKPGGHVREARIVPLDRLPPTQPTQIASNFASSR